MEGKNMTYSNVNINEEFAPRYVVDGSFTTANGSAVLNVSFEVEVNDPLFTPDSDEAFQDILDRLSASPYISLNGATKRWTANRSVTPTP